MEGGGGWGGGARGLRASRSVLSPYRPFQGVTHRGWLVQKQWMYLQLVCSCGHSYNIFIRTTSKAEKLSFSPRFISGSMRAAMVGKLFLLKNVLL